MSFFKFIDIPLITFGITLVAFVVACSVNDKEKVCEHGTHTHHGAEHIHTKSHSAPDIVCDDGITYYHYVEYSRARLVVKTAINGKVIPCKNDPQR